MDELFNCKNIDILKIKCNCFSDIILDKNYALLVIYSGMRTVIFSFMGNLASRQIA